MLRWQRDRGTCKSRIQIPESVSALPYRGKSPSPFFSLALVLPWIELRKRFMLTNSLGISLDKIFTFSCLM